MRSLVISMTLAAALAGIATAEPKAAATPRERAAENRALVARYANSVATVRYYTKRNADGEKADFSVPYKCPNCSGTHWRTGGENAAKGIPAEFAGYVIAPDRVLMKDLRVRGEFVVRIEVVCAGETVRAVEFERCPDQEALVLKTERPLAKAKPLKFTGGGEPKDPRYFFLVRENGESVAGVSRSRMGDFRHHVEIGRDFYAGVPNTLVLDESGAAVTIALQDRCELGKETFSSPATWRREPAAAYFRRLAELEKRLRQSVFPVYVQLEARPKDEGLGLERMIRMESGSSADNNDLDTTGILLEGGNVLVQLTMPGEATARLAKLEATLPDGKKAALKFVGSNDGIGGLVAVFASGVPKGLRPLRLDRRTALGLLDEELAVFSYLNRGGKLDMKCRTGRVAKFVRTEGNEIEPAIPTRSGQGASACECLALTRSGDLVALAMDSRERNGDWRSSSLQETYAGRRLAALVDAPKFDAENVPRAPDDRMRTAWLGVEVQAANADIVREKRALSYFNGQSADRAALVTSVAANSPAAKLGIRTGDILLTVRSVGSDDETRLRVARDIGGEFDWNEAFENARFTEVANTGRITPWPDAEGGVNAEFTKFGVGAKVVVAWVSDGHRREGETRLALAPVHYRNAPRARVTDLGLTVADLTREVRAYFKFADNAPGVVIAKLKSGGPAAVAGLKPLELVIQVDGVDVKDAKDFAAKVKGKRDLTLSVRRLQATRVVPIKLP